MLYVLVSDCKRKAYCSYAYKSKTQLKVNTISRDAVCLGQKCQCEKPQGSFGH
jgi:hypothetical protein